MKRWLAATMLILAGWTPTLSAADDFYGDPLPTGALARLGSARWRTGPCNFVEYSGDGKSIYTSYVYDGGGTLWYAERGMVRRWDRATGKESKRWPFSNVLCALNVARDRIMSSASEDIEVRSISEGAAVFSSKKRYFDTVALNPDGRSLAAWDDAADALTVWDLDRKHEKWSFATEHKKDTTIKYVQGGARLLFSPNGKLLALRIAAFHQKSHKGVGMVFLWDLREGKMLLNEKIENHWQRDIAFSPDSEVLAWNTSEGIVLRNVHKKGADRFLKMEKQGEHFPLPHMEFSPTGQALAVVVGRKVTFFDLAGDKARELAAAPEETQVLAFSPDGQELAGAGRTTLFRWEVGSGKLRDLPGQVSHSVDNIIFAGPDTIRTVAYDAVTVWEARSGREIRRHSLPGYIGLVISCDGKTYAMSRSDEVVICDLVSGKTSQTYRVGNGVESLEFLGQGQGLVIVTRDGKLHIRTEGKKDRTEPLPFPEEFARRRILSQQGKFVANACWAGSAFPPNQPWETPLQIPIIEVATGHALPTIKLAATPEKNHHAMAAAFTRDQRSLALGTILVDEKNRRLGKSLTRFFLMEVWSGQERFHFDGWNGMTTAIVMAVSGRFMAIADSSEHRDRPITVWDTVQGKIVAQFQQPNNVTSLAFSPDAARLASALCDSTVLIWDLSKVVSTTAKKLEEKELTALWHKLGSDNAREAYLAIHELAAAHAQAPAFLKARLPLPDADAKQIAAWIAELDDDVFAVRDEAQKRLARLGHRAEKELRKALTQPGSVEKEQRIRSILDGFHRWPSNQSDLQRLRALEVLEVIGSHACLQILEEQAARAPEAWRAEEARAAVARLKHDAGR